MLCTTSFTEQSKLALTRIERGVGGPRCTTEQEDKYIRVSSLRNRLLTSHQLVASLNSTRKTPVSTSTVKRRLRDESSSVQCLCYFANLNLFFLLANLRYGFFFANLPKRPASRVASSLLTLRLVFCGYYLMKLPVEDL